MDVEKSVKKQITLHEIVTERFEALVSNSSQVKILTDLNG
jgi:(R,R)-butanediol dehydrogenase/meso-butanediol dehydrogenase/diacetyl reductase